jgi:hypothetical protein
MSKDRNYEINVFLFFVLSELLFQAATQRDERNLGESSSVAFFDAMHASSSVAD